MIFFITLFRYFKFLFYFFHSLSSPFPKGCWLEKGHFFACSVFPFIKKKKKKTGCNLLVQPNVEKFRRGLELLQVSCVEVIKWLRLQGRLDEVMECVKVAPFWPQNKSGLQIFWLEEPFKLSMLQNLLVQPLWESFTGGWSRCAHMLESCEVTRPHSRIYKEVVVVIATNLRRSTACLYQGKWSRFLHWCCGRNIAPCKATSSS